MIADEDEKALEDRPPVVTILGHVDHGKTTLLDAIRDTNVQAGEAGGITQHIGAYQVVKDGQTITFLDTPGHAAFTAMRARGAQGADIVILVVAADDGVMPQTKEAIAHAKAARVPIIVALNKIDKGNANPELVKKQLADNELTPDDWEGDTMVIPVSALNNEGIEDLLEAILLVSDSIDIRANPEGDVLGTVIEAELDKAIAQDSLSDQIQPHDSISEVYTSTSRASRCRSAIAPSLPNHNSNVLPPRSAVSNPARDASPCLAAPCRTSSPPP